MKFTAQNEEKGLFTFYREQAEEEERMKRKRAKKKVNPDTNTNTHTNTNANTNMNIQLASQVTSNIDQPADNPPPIKQPASSSRSKLNPLQSRTQSLPRQLHEPKYAPIKKRFGDSVIVINRDKQQGNPQQLTDKQPTSGRYIKNRELQFQNGVKRVNQNSVSHRRKQPKKLILNYRYPRSSFDYQSSQRMELLTDRVESDKLPSLAKQPSQVTYLIPKRYKSKLLQQVLKGAGGSGAGAGNELFRQIRGKIIEENHNKVLEDNLHGGNDFSVSYVEYGSGGWQEKKSGQGLNHKQKRILQLLHNYRKI